MQSMSFHPVVADIGAQVVTIGTNCLEEAAKASMSMTGLAPAGADEVSLQAVMAFHTEAASLLALNQAAQEELMRAGSAFTQIAQTYTEVDEAAATLVFGSFSLPSFTK
ncbi:PE family immunomodulator PE35 [Mycobacterium simulans]|uniref:PE family immunomodulator PE35 n=1 Tax=Mycobacterium simulans TaxID=627089 RepID=A0A7Z7IL22_9MYCO|nr:PE family protein [Mycobacterium simulans]SOJ55550.1 PE family immunomodulator PE35 [Mycobacterium simulans]